MTVAELIDLLQRLNPTDQVIIAQGNACTPPHGEDVRLEVSCGFVFLYTHTKRAHP